MWNPTPYKDNPIIRLGDGENTALTPFEIKESELTYSRNLDSQYYPAMSVRPGRAVFTTSVSTSPNCLGQRNNEYMMAVFGNTWKYKDLTSTGWTDLTTTLASTDKPSIIEFVTGTSHISILMNNSTTAKYWNGTSTAADFGDANTPATNLVTAHRGRVYALKNKTLSFSALNLPNDWTTADDSGSIFIVNAKGAEKALLNYADHVIAFFDFSMHELYGTGPLNYELVDVGGGIGCVGRKAWTVCNGILYWLFYTGVQQYKGGFPDKVFDQAKHYIDNINWTYKDDIAMGSADKYIYLSIPYGSTATQNNLTLKFDTEYNLMFPETGGFKDFITIQNYTYGVDYNGVIYKLRSGTDDGGTAISWEGITKPFWQGSFEPKTVSDMSLIAESTANITVSYSTLVYDNNSTTFRQLSAYNYSTNTTKNKIHIPTSDLQNVDWYRLRFSGSGPAKIHYLVRNARVNAR